MQIVGQATTSQEAIDVCLELLPDVTLMDASLPTIDGIGAT